jgi:hypothetical protein
MAACPVTPPPHGYAQGALHLTPKHELLDALDCRRQDCERWYKTTVGEDGTFSVEVAAQPSGGAPGDFSVVLWDATLEEPLARVPNAGLGRVRLDRKVPANTYLVSVVAANRARPFDFQVIVDFAPAPPPPPPEPPAPQFRTHTSSILEQVGYGQDTVAVLLESGSNAGMRVGLRGRLVDEDMEIGAVVIEQVYPDGSRARVEGSLRAPVTHRTVAEIEVPIGLVLEEPEPDRAPGDEGARP